MKHLPGSLAAQIKATCQKHVSRGNILSTSYKDTLKSMQVHNVNFYNHFLLPLIKVGLSLQEGDKTVTQMLRNNKLSWFRKGMEEQKQRYTSVRIKNERENRKIWSLERRKVWAEREHRRGHESKLPWCAKGESKQKVHLPISDELSCRWISHAGWDEERLKVQTPGFRAISPREQLCHGAVTEHGAERPMCHCLGLTATAAQPNGE